MRSVYTHKYNALWFEMDKISQRLQFNTIMFVRTIKER